MKYIFLLILSFSAVLTTYGQEPNYQRITSEMGLATSFSFQMYQDRFHNIWLATNIGISKYDGDKIKNYTKKDGVDPGSIFNITENPNGDIFFIGGRVDVIYSYDYTTDKFERLKLDTSSYTNKSQMNMTSILVDNDNNFSIGFSKNNGHTNVSKKGNVKFYDDTLKKGIVINKFTHGLAYQQYSTEDSIFLNGVASHYDNQNSMHLNAVQVDNEFLALGDNKQLSIFKDNTPLITKHFDKIIIALNVDNSNQLWVSFYTGGTICFKIENDRLIRQNHLLKNYSVSTVLEDHEGGYWISTLEDGLFYSPSINTKFYGKDSEISGMRVLGIASYKEGEVAMGFSNNTITVFRSDTIYKTYDFKEVRTKSNSRITGILGDKANDQFIILSTHFAYTLKNDTIKKIKHSIRAEQMLIDEKNNGYWYGNKDSLWYYRNDTILESYLLDYSKLSGLRYGLNRDIILFSRSKGIEKFDLNTKKIENYNLRDDLDVKNIRNIQNFRDSVLLVYSEKGVHFITQLDTNFFSNQRPDKDDIYFVCASLGKNNVLWMSSHSGLKKLTFEKDTILYEEYSKEIGMLHKDQKCACGQKEEIFLTTNGGLYIIPEVDIYSTIPSFPIIKSVATTDSLYTLPINNINFDHDENNLTFQLHVTTFKYKDEYLFEYQIDNMDTEFRPLGGSELNLTNLEYGEYTLNYRVKTFNNVYSPISSFSFIISTPFWSTWWFIIAIGSVIGLIIFLIVRKIVLRLIEKEKKKSEMKELIHSLRLQAIQSQFNPHFTFNAISSIQHHMSASTIDDAKNYLGMFSSIMRSILTNSEKETILVSEEIKLLETYLKLEKLRFRDKLNYQFKIHPSVDVHYDRIPPMIIQPLLENAINYGIFNKPDGGSITIEFSVQDDILNCIVIDNGIGCEAAREIQKIKKMKGNGKGLKLVKERLAVANKRIKNYFELVNLYDEKGNASGTKIILKLELND